MADARKRRGKEVPVDDEAFPRGGSDGLTHLERRSIEQAARAEVEVELAAGGSLTAPKSGSKKRAKQEDADVGVEGLGWGIDPPCCVCHAPY